MKFTLSKVSHNARLSEETHCFSAVLNVNGKPYFEVTNRGHGGCDDYNPLPGQTMADFNTKMDEVTAHLKTLPKEKFMDKEMDASLEVIVGDLMNDHLVSKEIKRKMSKKTLITIKGKEGVYAYPSPYSPEYAQRLRSATKFSVDQILNELPLEEAAAIYRKNT